MKIKIDIAEKSTPFNIENYKIVIPISLRKMN